MDHHAPRRGRGTQGRLTTPGADTIAAIATANGAAGVGIVRLSGPGAAAIAVALLGHAPRPRHAHRCEFRDAAGGAIDHGLLLHFPAPHSFTGEDVAELHAHGSPVVLRALLARTIELGARPARPGEFSERAFLNGKLDLVQAEAVADLIAAGSTAAARAAVRSLEGAFSDRVHAITDAVKALRTDVEATIDFADEALDPAIESRQLGRLAAVAAALDELLGSARRGARLTDGLTVAIAGAPNVGKSSLLNALAGTERAIVAEIPGTTRDVLRESVELDGIVVVLADTAGLRTTADPVEAEGVRRAHAEIMRADVVVLVDDASVAAVAAPLPDGVDPATTIRVHNKIDLAGLAARIERKDGAAKIWLSARTGAGLGHLVDELRRRAGLDTDGTGTFSARARHVDALERARMHITAARATPPDAPELLAEELRHAQRALGEITGEVTTEDLLGSIFATFCIGK